MKPIQQKKPKKDDREKLVLLGLVEHYLATGKPVGSNTLRESGFESLSSATIRNYFGKLEEAGYLKQQHSSGGRIPTNAAYKLYADSHLFTSQLDEKEKKILSHSLGKQTREIGSYLQKCAETLSEWTNAAVFLSAPRFDQDFVLDAKLIAIDSTRCLCVLITDFGLIRTEVLYTDKKLSTFTMKRIEQYFQWKMTGLDKPELSKEEEEMAVRFYHEAMLRHIVGYTNFSSMDLHKTGFSKLLSYPDFNDAASLASGLGFFENNQTLQSMLSLTCKKGALTHWIGEDLVPFSSHAAGCSVIIIPYYIHQTIAGAIGILGPCRIPYKRMFGVMKALSDVMSENLTKSLYKFKISFRHPDPLHLENKKETFYFHNQASRLQLEDQTTQE